MGKPENDDFIPMGFKALRVGELDWTGELRIYSSSLPYRWRGTVTEMERCADCGCASPSKECNCGIHASFHVGVVITEYMTTPQSFLTLVEGRGRYWIGQFGWRAQQSLVVAVLQVSPTDEYRMTVNRQAAKYFGAEVKTLEWAVETLEQWKRYYASRLVVEK